MSKFWLSLSKTSMTGIIAVIIVLNLSIINIICMFHKPADNNLAILIVGNLYGLAGFVAGYYFNKKINDSTAEKQEPKV